MALSSEIREKMVALKQAQPLLLLLLLLLLHLHKLQRILILDEHP
jgi:hypothetical protein